MNRKNSKSSLLLGDDPERCYLCGAYGRMEVHHCIHGTARRKIADQYGLTVHLCGYCHRQLHDKGTYDKFLMAEAQKAFEAEYGHEAWLRKVGKNFV